MGRPMARLLRRGLAGLILLALVLAAGWCRLQTPANSGSATVILSATAMRSRIAELAACPSPLDRLGIGRIRPKVMVGGDEVDLVIPAASDPDGSMVRFTLDPVPGSSGSMVRVRWQVRLADGAAELDLGEDRLLNPVVLARELEAAVESHVRYYATITAPGAAPVAAYQRAEQARTCRKAGRLIDAIAVVTNPALRQTIERQRKREALGWLFKDDFRLGGSSYSSDWDADYAGF